MTLKEQAKQNLLDFKKVMDGLGIPFCLMDGTLLGYYREKDFIVGDESDIDVGVMEEYYDKIAEIVKGLVELGFGTTKAFIVDGNVEGRCATRGGNHIDIMKMNRRNDKVFNIGRSFGGRNGLPPTFAYCYPAYHFDKFEPVEFQGEQFFIPFETEKLLEIRFENWKVPVSRSNYDFLSKKDVPCIFEDWRNI